MAKSKGQINVVLVYVAANLAIGAGLLYLEYKYMYTRKKLIAIINRNEQNIRGLTKSIQEASQKFPNYIFELLKIDENNFTIKVYYTQYIKYEYGYKQRTELYDTIPVVFI